MMSLQRKIIYIYLYFPVQSQLLWLPGVSLIKLLWKPDFQMQTVRKVYSKVILCSLQTNLTPNKLV